MELLNSTLFWDVVNFLILMFLLSKFLYKPVMDIMDKRKERIKSDLDGARMKKEEAQKLYEEYRARLNEAKEKGEKIVQEAEERAKARENEIIKEAKDEARKILQRASEEAELIKSKALMDIKEQAAYLSVTAAAKLLREQLDEERHLRLVEEYIDSLDVESLGEVQ